MKKRILFVVFIGIICILTSCAKITNKIKTLQDISTIQTIDIYYAEQRYYEGDVNKFLEDNIPIYTINTEMQEEFLEMISSLEYEKEVVFFPIPMDGGYDYQGYIISIVYTNGSYDIIAEGGLFSYSINENGETKYKYDYSNYSGKTEWSTLIEMYIED